MTPELWIALSSAPLALVGVWLGAWLTARHSVAQRRADVLRDAFGRYLAACAAWTSLGDFHTESTRIVKPPPEALADAQPALQVLHILAPDVAIPAGKYLAMLENIVEFAHPNLPHTDGVVGDEARIDIQARMVKGSDEQKRAVLIAMRRALNS
ncbi:hypothetical protein [Cellulomonas dongxiuzhuiae]|uniref:DUF2489 domain-containing protein n=1 Tax=Cellulomonas dongxiuzhuiae TaxID=2819979 RepID=A0ABX8GNB2_9CELL|nr:hypothetical protein [Cellulomonas dongxiuzhuiae]MBO3095846.1 hypothetical protein [Cellulomonas dongxiuzhuiae]QWC17152.1 hypothetical protein KKR89_06000 [Cellulomonas dongxiuzhuiae]